MHASTDSEQITHLTENLVKARGDLADADARLDAARGRVGATAQAAISPSVVRLRAMQNQLAAQIQSQQGRLGSSHPEAQAMSLSVNGFVNDLVRQFPMEYSVELKRLIDLEMEGSVG